MTPEQAADLADRTLAAIDAEDVFPDHRSGRFRQADRERVMSDLAGLRDHQPATDEATYCTCMCDYPCPDAARYADGLRRTARLYGVTP